ncbi:MAG: geranylgeranylglycerol-phosphate geranylgeranyltransferase [Bacteroidia bacterium]|nr:geranylgeranylglycerol-phosphate geranylgeranyltransferase [Bacteroidia bacterium]
MLPFLRLIRPWNLFIVVFTMYMVRYFLVAAVLASWDMHLVMPEWLFALLVASVVMIAAAGYIINDYFDIKIDRVNKPGEVVVEKEVPRRAAMAAHFVLNALGVLTGIFVSWKSGIFSMGALVFVFAASGLWFYSTDFKRKFLWGNLLISLLSCMIAALPVVYELPFLVNHFGKQFVQTGVSYNSVWVITAVLCGFAFLLSWVRELVKDMEDAEGDRQFGCRTFPIVMGMSASKILGTILLLLVLSLIAMVLLAHPLEVEMNSIYSFLYTCGILILTLILVFLLWKAKDKEHFRKVSMFIKVIMLAGICYWFLFAWMLSNGYWLIR